MDWTKGLGYISNNLTILCITSIVVCVIVFVPDSEYAGTVITAGISGMIGYLKGISTSK